MKFFCCLLCLFALLPVAFAQSNAADCMAHARNLLRTGDGFFEKNKPQALETYRTAERLLDSCGLRETAEMGTVQHQLGRLFTEMSLGESLPFFREAMRVREIALPPDDPELAKSIHNVGSQSGNMALLKRALIIKMRQPRLDTLTVLVSLGQIGSLFSTQLRFDSADLYLQKNLALTLQKFGPVHRRTLLAREKIASCYIQKTDYQSAADIFDELLPHVQRMDGRWTAGLLLNAGNAHLNLGEYEKAIALTEQALRLAQTTLHDEGLAALAHQNLALCLTEKMEFEPALEHAKKCLEIRTNILDESHTDFGKAYYQPARVLNKAGHFRESLEYLKKGCALLEKQMPGHPELYPFEDGIANIHAVLGELEAANAIFFRHLAEDREHFPDSSPFVVSDFYCIANAFELAAKHRAGEARALLGQALAWSDSALVAAGFFAVEAPSNRRLLADILHQKADCLEALYHLTGEADFLRRELDCRRQTLDAVRHNFEVMSAEASRQTLLEKNQRYFESAISAALEATRVLKEDSLRALAFDFAERAKAQTLLDAFRSARARHDAHLPDSVLQRERSLRSELAFWEKHRLDLLAAGLPDTARAFVETNARLLETRHQNEVFEKRLRREHPAYHRLKFGQATLPIAEAQRHLLGPSKTLVEFFVGETDLTVFALNSDGLHARQVPLTDSLQKTVDSIRFGLYAYHAARSRPTGFYERTLTAYRHAARRLYQLLLAPVEARLGDTLIIVPDGELNYIPFEALLTAEPPPGDNFQTYPFLLRQKTISYCYSATLLAEMRARQFDQSPADSLLAFAPFAADGPAGGLRTPDEGWGDDSLRAEFWPLPFSKTEALDACAALPGKALFGSAASREAFFREAGHYRYLLLATHAEANDHSSDFAFLAFGGSDDTDSVFLRELYALPLRADLVVLSACRTGIGQLKKGEGLVSLARAFSYAGAKSLVTTLWKVRDRENSEVMRGFFKSLTVKGISKDEALRQAKLQFLAAHKGQSGHPFFWAGPIGLGDMRGL